MDWASAILGITTIVSGAWTAWLTWQGMLLRFNQSGLTERVRLLEQHVKECRDERDSMKELLHEPVPSDINEVVMMIEKIRAATKGAPKDLFSDFNIEILAKALVARRKSKNGTVEGGR